MRKIFLMKFSGKSHGPDSPKESFMLAKRFVPRMFEEASMKTNYECRTEKTPVF